MDPSELSFAGRRAALELADLAALPVPVIPTIPPATQPSPTHCRHPVVATALARAFLSVPRPGDGSRNGTRRASIGRVRALVDQGGLFSANVWHRNRPRMLKANAPPGTPPAPPPGHPLSGPPRSTAKRQPNAPSAQTERIPTDPHKAPERTHRQLYNAPAARHAG